MKRSLSAFLAATVLCVGSAHAAVAGEGAQTAGYTLTITGFVPVICRATIDATIVPGAAGETNLGELNEFCNSPNGYQVFVQGSPELANATLVVDGNSVALSGNGPTLVAASNGPAIETRSLSLNLPEGGVSGSLSVQIVAL